MSSPAGPGAEDAPRQTPLGAGDPEAPEREDVSRPARDRAVEDFARRSGLRRDEAGQLDVLSAVGGWRGLLESLLPGLVYLVCVVVTGQLGPALTASLAAAALFTLVRLVQRQPVTQALGGLVGVGICAIHQDPALFPEPDHFRPERFVERTYTPYEFLPFGGGHRRCLGMALAEYQLRLALADIVTRWDLAPDGEDQDVRRNIGMGPKHGLLMRVVGRRGAS